MFPQILSTLIQGGAKLLEKNVKPQSNNGGVSSVMAKEPAEMQQATPQGGSLANKQQLIDKAKDFGVNALTGQLKAKLAGKAQKAYLAESFPEMNPWERAGATATGAGPMLEGQNTQEKMQKKQFKQEKDLQKNQLDLQRDIATEQFKTQKQIGIYNADSSVAAAQASALPGMLQTDHLNKLRAAQTWEAQAREDLTHEQVFRARQDLLNLPYQSTRNLYARWQNGRITAAKFAKDLAALRAAETVSGDKGPIVKFGKKRNAKKRSKDVDDYPVIE